MNRRHMATLRAVVDGPPLATATAQRQKQLKAFHGTELDAIQNIENLKAAIMVLSKHHGGAFPLWRSTHKMTPQLAQSDNMRNVFQHF